MTESTLLLELAELEGAEDFLDYFAIDYDPAVVQVNRLHILQRFHDYLQGADTIPQDDAGMRECYARHLQRAHDDFVTSDALKEKVFKIFHQAEAAKITFVPLSDAFR